MQSWIGVMAVGVLLLMPGCLVAGEHTGRDEDEWTWDDAEGDDGRHEERLGHRTTFTPGPGTHSFKVVVPDGGATGVSWRLTITGASAESHIEGPGCDSWLNQVGSVGTSNASGGCSDLAAGEYRFTVELYAAAVEFDAEIRGLVLD